MKKTWLCPEYLVLNRNKSRIVKTTRGQTKSLEAVISSPMFFIGREIFELT